MNRRFLPISVVVISFLMLTPVLQTSILKMADAQADTGRNSKFPNYDQWATGFNPQTQVTKDNVQYLELKWIFPWPESRPIAGFASTTPGSIALPLIIDGIVYTRAEDLTVYAIDARNGKLVWSYRPPNDVVNLTAAQRNLPITLGLSSHSHMFSYFEGKIYVPWPNCQVLGLNALTGKVEFQLKTPVCANIEGNKGLYKGLQSVGPVFDAKRRMLIYGTADSENVDAGRGAFRGYNVDTGELKWTFYLMPAQCQSDPEWTLRIANKGWIQGIRATSLPREVLLNDWHYQGLAVCKGGVSTGGVGIGWGQWAVDEDTGVVYAATAQPSPDWNATYRPGPNALSDSVLALKTDTGEMLWWHQIHAHDLWDVDCSWNTALAVVNGKKTVFKECKGGSLYALDAATGEPIWKTDYSPYAKRGALAPRPNYEELLDPKSVADMTRPWLSYPGNQPNWRRVAGGAESDVAIAYGKVFSSIFHSWGYQTFSSVEPTQRSSSGRVSVPVPTTYPRNTTLFAHDLATGRLIWKYDIDEAGIRGGASVSGGLVWILPNDGTVRAIDAETGKLVWSKFHGVAAPVQPVFGADGDGKTKMFMILGSGGLIGGGSPTPGALLAYGLPDQIPQPQVITKEVPKEVVKEVVKEVPKEVVKEVPKEVIKEVPKEIIKEVVKEVPKETVRTVTVETISPISYAAIGIGVVLIVIAGVLFTRRKT